MRCQIAQERIVLAAYGELAEDQASELKQHMAACPECAGAQEQLLSLKALADALPVLEPDANLVARARLKLDEALDALPSRRWYHRLGQSIMNDFASAWAAPIAACLLLVVGAGAGSLSGYQFAQTRATHTVATQSAQALSAPVLPPAASVSAPAEIANISSIVRQPNGHMVEVRYNQVIPQRLEGSLDDPAIRQLLMLASENSASARVRDDSVGLMADECRAGHSCRAAGMRDALLMVLRYDKNASVRQKALHGLEPYVAEDTQVRDAVLEALMSDGDPGIRTAAINILGPVEADTSVRQVLHTVSNTDENPYIRNVSRQVLNSVPEIQ
ncbi:MAG: HEAT repeat domain-containing protein [Terracidiphilus sp.]